MSDDDHEIRPRDHGEEIALFRFGVIGALTRRTLARGELRAEMRSLQAELPPAGRDPHPHLQPADLGAVLLRLL